MSAGIPVLTYASRHTQVLREHDRTVIIVPPDTHWFSWLPLGLIAVLGLACLVLTCWPSGVTRTRYGEVRFPHGAPARIAALTVAVICLASARAGWRIRSGVTSLTVRGNTLTRSMPSIFGVRETSYDLAEWADAMVALLIKRSMGTRLTKRQPAPALGHRQDGAADSARGRQGSSGPVSARAAR